MFLCKLVRYFACAIYLFTLAEFKVINCIMKTSSRVKNSMVQQNLTNNNIAIYIGYANNPFGPSKKFNYKKYMRHISSLPNLRNNEGKMENEVDTGQLIWKKNDGELRSKRGVIELYNMIKCATGCNPIIYKGYGCFCGLLGSGIPVDGIDSCCQMHDLCYEYAECFPFLEYLLPYFWKCYKHRPLCATRQNPWDALNTCAARLCECDRVLAECLSKYPCPTTRAICHSSPWRYLQNTLMINID